MAVLKAPLLSIDASGKFANAIVYSKWKGLKTARQHVTPSNPKTAAQIAQRALVTAMVAAWKNYFTDATGRAAWNRSALNDSRPMSGFNKFGAEVLPIITSDSDASYANTGEAVAGQLCKFGVKNIDDGVAGDEGGLFEIWVGSTVSGMTLNDEQPTGAGQVQGVVDLGDEGDVKYVKIRKDSYDRSGIFKITLLA